MSWLSKVDQDSIDQKIREIKATTAKNYPANNLVEIINAYDSKIEIKEFDFDDDSAKIKGAIKYADGSSPTILINPNHTSDEGRNFTLAHEFAHYVLHENQEKFRIDLFDYAKNTLESKQETEANYFAASLLMPKEELQDMLELTDSTEKIAAYFGVSVPAVETRMKWLKINN